MNEGVDARPRGWKFRVGLLAAGLEAFSAIALLGTSAYLISRASEQPPILYLMIAVVGVRAFALGRAAFRYLQRLMLHDAVFTHLANLRPQLFERLVDLTPAGFSGARGERLNRLTADVDELQNLGIRIIGPMVQAALALVVAFSILIGFFPLVAVVTSMLSGISLLVTIALTRLAARSSEDLRIELRSRLRSVLVEYLENVEVLESLGWSRRYRTEIELIEREIGKAERTSALASGLAASLTGFSAVFVVVIGALLAPAALAGGTAGNLLAVAVLLPLATFDIFSGFQVASAAWQKYRSAKVRVDALYAAPIGPELRVSGGAQNLGEVSEIELEGAELRLGGKVIHQSLNLSLKSGRLAAIVGPSGSGKTTAALALSSLIQPTAGRLLINGKSAEEFSVQSRRGKVLLIEQDPHIFAGTVRQNLEISGVSDEGALSAALAQVNLAEELADRGGLDAPISESAGNISGGQAQRIAIARGLLVDAAVFILDEPSSGLDWDNASALLEVLRTIRDAGKLVVIITHDEQIARLCDETLELGQRLV